MADFSGRTLEIGALYAVLARLRGERDSGAHAIVSRGEGPPELVSAADIIRAADLLHNRALRSWIGQHMVQWWAQALQATSQVVAGTGTSSIAVPQYHPAMQTLSSLASLCVETGGATSGANSCVRYFSTANFWIQNGTRHVFRCSARNLAEIQAARFGLWGNNATPTSTGRPGYGAWFEFDRAISPTLLYLCSADGGAVASSSTAIALDGNWRTWVVDQTSSGFRCYEVEAGNLAQVCTTSTPVVSSAQAASVRPFWQIEKVASATANWGDLYCSLFAPILGESYIRELP